MLALRLPSGLDTTAYKMFGPTGRVVSSASMAVLSPTARHRPVVAPLLIPFSQASPGFAGISGSMRRPSTARRLNNTWSPDVSVTGNSPELDELLLDGMENLGGLSDARLREYAIHSLKEEGATSGSTLAELATMAAMSSARVRERHSEALASGEGVGLVQMFIDTADHLERELRTRALPN